MFILCVYIFFPSVFAYEVTMKPNSSETVDFSNLPINATVSNNDIKTSNTPVTERITQPLQPLKVERISESFTSLNNSIKVDDKTNFKDFKPSPQLETYYEYNKFPVVPAMPEAKSFGDFSNPGYSLNEWSQKPSVSAYPSQNQGVQNSWYENTNRENAWNQNFNTNPKPSTEDSWITRIKFPTSTVNFSNDKKINSYLPPVNFPTTTEGFAFDKPVAVPNRNTNNVSPGFWQKLMGNVNPVNKNAVAVQKPFLDYNLMEKPPHYNAHESGVSHASGNPWTKIAKLLSAVIPIGLLISALTPTVITVTSTNDTQSRYRSSDITHQDIEDRLASSFKHAEQFRSCEDKVLCELLLAASVSKNSEENINNLLDAFAEHEDLRNKKEDLLKVFEAVKRGHCSLIVCKSTKA